MRNVFKIFLLMFLAIGTACSEQANDKQSIEGQQDQSLENQRDRSPIPSQLIQLSLACVNYMDVNKGRFPVPYTEDPEGENGQTWRDILAPQMSGLRGFPGCAALVDPDGVFPPPDDEHETQYGVASAGCEDGFSYIISFVELADPASEQSCITVDEFYAQLQNCPEDKQGFYVAMVSGEVYLLDKSASKDDLRALTTIKGHEPIPEKVLKAWSR